MTQRHLKSVTPRKETAAQRGKRLIARLAELRREKSLALLRIANLEKEEGDVLLEIAGEGYRLETGSKPRRSPEPEVREASLPSDIEQEALAALGEALGR